MEKEYGLLKGEKCNRNGCNGIIDEHEKEGCCSCHINPPCSYCTTPSEYCPECGWDAEEEQREYENHQAMYYAQNPPKKYAYKTDEELFRELKNGELGYVRVCSGAHSVVRLKGKHPNLTIGEIYRRLNLHENPQMPRMKRCTNTEFELTYFCD